MTAFKVEKTEYREYGCYRYRDILISRRDRQFYFRFHGRHGVSTIGGLGTLKYACSRIDAMHENPKYISQHGKFYWTEEEGAQQ